MRDRAAAETRLGQDIGPLPKVVDRKRREACRKNFLKFCETYLTEDTFRAPWSEHHLQAIKRIERVVIQGQFYAVAMPRGMGKSSLCEAAVLWAILYGWHRYVVLFATTDDKFMDESQASIKTLLETNEKLYEDFPEVCHPIRALNGQTNKQKGQHLNGERTQIQWNGKRLFLPVVEGSECSGSVIGGGGLGAKSIRGSRFRDKKTGILWRPSLVLIDDPQSDESAESVKQCGKLERLVSAGILGMAGPGEKIAALMPCTVIARGDLADRMCDREKHPEWHGLRLPMLMSWPLRMDLWEEYRDVRATELKSDDDLELDACVEDPHPKATAFLQERFELMHEGAQVSWEHRRRPYELSAVQHAMHLYFRDPVGFWSEYQNWVATANCPAEPDASEQLRLDKDALAVRVSGYDRRVIPADVQHLTVGIDCHDRVLTWMLCGWETDFSGYILDYGTYPETKRDRWEVGSFRPTLKEMAPKASDEGALTAGLEAVVKELFRRTFKREDGAQLMVRQGLVDTNYLSAVVRRYVAASGLVDRLMPSFGRAPQEDEAPISSYKQGSGEEIGDEWLKRLPKKGAGRQSGLQHLLFDTNHWKTFAARRLLSQPGDCGTVQIYGHVPSIDKKGNGRPGTRHDFLARHLCSELPSEVVGKRKMTKWKMRPGETNNHWLDNLVQCCVAASVLGLKPPGSAEIVQQATPSKPQRLRVNLVGPDGRAFFISDR